MKVRSTVSADISMHVIWVNSTDFDSTVKAVKVHEILVYEFGYTDSLTLEEGNRGKGVSISVCDFSNQKRRGDKVSGMANPRDGRHVWLQKAYRYLPP